MAVFCFSQRTAAARDTERRLRLLSAPWFAATGWARRCSRSSTAMRSMPVQMGVHFDLYNRD